MGDFTSRISPREVVELHPGSGDFAFFEFAGRFVSNTP